MSRRVDLGKVVGPQGPQGKQGAQGIQGPQGKGANNGTELTSQDLNSYKTEAQCGWYYAGGGNTVKNKPSGADAFGMWLLRVANGYYQQEIHLSTGTHAGKTYVRTWQSTLWTSWVEKGKDGAQGPQGKQGNTGPAGTTPTIGSNGNWYLGATDTGKPSRGVQGPQGAKGEKGDTGAQGPQGPKGDTGPQPALSNTLTSTSTTVALTAAQGKALNDKITNILNGVSAPMTEV